MKDLTGWDAEMFRIYDRMNEDKKDSQPMEWGDIFLTIVWSMLTVFIMFITGVIGG